MLHLQFNKINVITGRLTCTLNLRFILNAMLEISVIIFICGRVLNDKRNIKNLKYTNTSKHA